MHARTCAVGTAGGVSALVDGEAPFVVVVGHHAETERDKALQAQHASPGVAVAVVLVPARLVFPVPLLLLGDDEGVVEEQEHPIGAFDALAVPLPHPHHPLPHQPPAHGHELGRGSPDKAIVEVGQRMQAHQLMRLVDGAHRLRDLFSAAAAADPPKTSTDHYRE